MVMKRAFVFIAFFALALLSACTGGSGTNYANENYRTGSDGLWYQLATNLPPSRIYDDQTLDVLVELENRGATAIGGPGDRIYLSGFDPTIITGISAYGQQVPTMQGKNQYGPGDKSYVSFKGVPVSLYTRRIDKYTPKLQITSCYQYDTVATANVCVDPDPNSIVDRQKACTAHNVGTGTQGAPVAVESVDVLPSPGVTRFEMIIQNVGRGNPFRAGIQYLQRCSPFDAAGLAYNELDYVQLIDVTVSGTSIRNSCRPLDGGMVRLVNGQARLYCTFDHVPGSSAYTTPLTVTLRYGYRETQWRDITIVQSMR
jgi:hypothetical protein